VVCHPAFGKALHIQTKTFLAVSALLGRSSLKAIAEATSTAVNFVLEGHQGQLNSKGVHFPTESTL